MLVGIDARYGFRKERRGIGIYIYNLLKELGKMEGARYTLYVDGQADPDLVKSFSGKPFTVRQISCSNLLYWEQVLLPLAARRDGVDILHCTANIAPLIKVCPVIITLHDVIEFRRAVFEDTRLTLRHRLSRLYRLGLLPFVTRKANLVLTGSDFSRRDIIEVLKLPPERMCMTYYGPPDKSSLTAAKSGLNGEKYILALGAMDKRKNTGVLFEAYKILRKETDLKVKLIVAGVEKPDVFIKEYSLLDHPFAGDIICRGFVEDSELAGLYRECECFVYPSLYEGFGLPPLEAMGAGAPVIASKTTSVGEIVGDAGLLFNPLSPEELAEKIKAVLISPGLAGEIRKKGMERVNFFSWEKCASETLAAYREVYGERSSQANA